MKMRGQAFETMMLVISVIVAVAILGILLSFLGGIGTFGANAKEVLPDLVKKVSQRGYGVEVRGKVEFTAADRFYRKNAIGESAVAENNLDFFCDDDAICGDKSAPLTVTENSIVVNKKITGAIATCTEDGVEYHIFIAAKDTEASSEAEETCNLA